MYTVIDNDVFDSIAHFFLHLRCTNIMLLCVYDMLNTRALLQYYIFSAEGRRSGTIEILFASNFRTVIRDEEPLIRTTDSDFFFTRQKIP